MVCNLLVMSLVDCLALSERLCMAKKQPPQQFLFLIMYGKKPIAVFQYRANAVRALASLKSILPKAYPVEPRIVEVPLQG